MSEFDLEIMAGREIFIGMELCEDWKKLVSPINNLNDYKKILNDYSDEIAKFSGLEKTLTKWDDEWGLTCVEAHYGNACALLLDKHNKQYYPHNIDSPEQAFALMATVLKYVHDVRIANSTSNDLPLNWDIWPIEIDAYRELFIKIDMHKHLNSKQLKRITSNFGKGLRDFIEKCAPFAKEGYTDLKEVKYNWDDELGLRSVEAIPGKNGSSLNLTKDVADNFYYLSHNIYNPIQVVALIGAVSKYLQYAKGVENKILEE